MTPHSLLVDRETVQQSLANSWIAPYLDELYCHSEAILSDRPHGDRDKWLEAIDQLPDIPVTTVQLDQDVVSCSTTVIDDQVDMLKQALMQLHPWRKGPFRLFGLDIDTEWRSNLKWQRISRHLSPLANRTVLDVGCGNGYYLYRMLGDGARFVLGIDPTQLYLAQFKAIQRYLQVPAALILPMKSEDFMAASKYDRIAGFDTVFSMGVYYHRKDTDQHLRELRRLLSADGELILETLVIDGEASADLQLEGRYAQMRNVWSIPTVPYLLDQLMRSGFCEPTLIDLTATTTDEQRATEWMQFDSLEQFLDPLDHRKTIEGHPAPLRATIKVRRSPD